MTTTARGLLATLGWHRFAAREPIEPDEEGLACTARVRVEHRGAYELVGASVALGEADAPSDVADASAGFSLSSEVSAELRRQATGDRAAFPVVGDWVRYTPPAEGDSRATITELLPRASALMRRARGSGAAGAPAQLVAANVDVVGVVTTAQRVASGADRAGGDVLERLLVAAAAGNCAAVVVVNKADVGTVNPAELRARLGPVDVLTTSALTGAGVGDLADLPRDGRTLCLVGASGVGKSSLINALVGRSVAATAALTRDGRGQHKTTRRTLHVLEDAASSSVGGTVVDTPGLQRVVPVPLSGGEAEGAGALAEAIADVFADVAKAAQTCRFSRCQHRSEPDCEVAAQIAVGGLQRERVESYQRLTEELVSDR